jgi:hypothetical protein
MVWGGVGDTAEGIIGYFGNNSQRFDIVICFNLMRDLQRCIE